MTTSNANPAKDDIARVAYAIWEAEGRPEGCDHEHWMRAKQLLLEGRAEAEFPGAQADGDPSDPSPRPVQPGFEDARPGIVPERKAEPGPDLQDGPGGRFARQLAEAPGEDPKDAPSGR